MVPMADRDEIRYRKPPWLKKEKPSPPEGEEGRL
jgi:hypothetical protein